MTVDVVVYRFDFFVIFLCWDVHNKFRVEVISCRHTVLILFAQWNGVEDSVKDFCVAIKVTSGVDHIRKYIDSVAFQKRLNYVSQIFRLSQALETKTQDT